MLWNWYTVDSCFIARSWHVTSRGMFAGSCVGVVLLTMSLELLRRAVKEYDRYLVRRAQQHGQLLLAREESSKMASGSPVPAAKAAAGFRPNVFQQAVRALLHMVQFAVAYFIMLYVFFFFFFLLLCVGWEIWEKSSRAFADREGRLAMYYNGYIIICIFIGAFLGSFVFHWETIGARSVHPKRGAGMISLNTANTSVVLSPEFRTSASREATVCCG